MATKFNFSVATAMTGLFAASSLFLVALIGQDFAPDAAAWRRSARGETTVAAATEVFRAMQVVRAERGSTLRVLMQPLGAEPETLAKLPEQRAQSANAVAAVTRGCAEVACPPGLGVADVTAAMDRMNILRAEVDAALKQEREKRREGIGADWTKAGLAAADILGRVSKALLEPLRLTDTVYADLFVMKDAALAARDAYTGVRMTLDVMMTSKEVKPELAKRLTAALGRMEGAWAPMREAAKRDTTPEPLRRAVETVERSYFADYLPAIEATVAALAERREMPMPIARLNAVADRSMLDLDAVGNTALDAIGARAAEIRSAATTRLVIEAIEFLAAIGLGIGGLLIVRRRMASPLRRMTEAMLRVAGNDLSGEVPHRDRADEIGELARTLVVFKDNAVQRERLESEQAAATEARTRRAATIDRLVRDFEAKAETLLGNAVRALTELSQTAERMSGLAEQTSGQATLSAAAAEQTSANVQTVASAAEEMAASIQDIGRQVGMSTTITGKAATQARETIDTVRGLAEAAGRIGEVVKMIQDVASQTNLLALNATIEAARAGEAGKGFAVVAGEVKNLANQTARATEEVSVQIDAVQTATRSTVDAIEEMGRTITSINEVATAIAAAIEEQHATTNEITRNVHEAAQGTREVSQNVGTVNAAGAETKAASARVHESAQRLAHEAAELRREVNDFLAAVRVA